MAATPVPSAFSDALGTAPQLPAEEGAEGALDVEGFKTPAGSENPGVQTAIVNPPNVAAAEFFTVKPTELTVQSLLGTGAQADVFKAVWTRSFAASTSSIVVAVKRLHAELGTVYRDREALALNTDHINIVKCFDSTLEAPHLVVTEFCAGGSLFDLLYNTRFDMTMKQRVKVLCDVAAGMGYLHKQKPCILHRDLKSSNVLLAKPLRSPEQVPLAKVADFGLSREVTDGGSNFQQMTVGVGTWRWMAPEVFGLDETCDYDARVDVFSFAMVMYEVLAGKLPYIEVYPQSVQDPRIGLHVLSGLRPSTEAVVANGPLALKQLMEKAWATDPNERPRFEEIEQTLLDVLATIDQ